MQIRYCPWRPGEQPACLFPGKLDVNSVVHKQHLLLQSEQLQLPSHTDQDFILHCFFYLLLEEWWFPDYPLNIIYFAAPKWSFLQDLRRILPPIHTHISMTMTVADVGIFAFPRCHWSPHIFVTLWTMFEQTCKISSCHSGVYICVCTAWTIIISLYCNTNKIN